MADIKISELTSVSSLNNGDLVEVSQVNELAPSGYTSLKASMADLGKKVNTDIEYTTDLADFTDKTTLGAIKETAKGKNIADEYDGTQTYNKGDVVIYKNTLYICQDDNVTGTWDSTKWSATTVDDLIPKTDNNLPHFSGTPTAGSTAEAIGAKQDKLIVTAGQVTYDSTNVEGSITQLNWLKYGRVVVAHLEFTPQSGKVANGNVVCSGLPQPIAYANCFGDNKQQFIVDSSGNLRFYFPTDTATLNRWDLNITYISAT